MLETLRFFRQFLRPRPDAVIREEITYRRGDQVLPASLYRPAASGSGTLPGWMALHGLTYKGREHPSLERFARALSASGAVVLVPDLPEWRELRVEPQTTVDTIRAAVLELDRSPLTAPGRIGAIGFSFGATQALIASTDPALEGHLAAVAAWGGYRDIRRATRFAFLGRHELDGREYVRDPDPYGRWILAGNYLPLLGGRGGDDRLAEEIRGLALEAGRREVMSWEPELDPVKAAARDRLAPDQRELFDLIAPPAGTRYTADQRARIEALVDRMTDAALEHEPLLDPGGHLDRIPVPVLLAHGRGDRLVPWTEMVRLRRSIPDERVACAGLTSLFSHSFGERRLPTPGVVLEAVRFARLIRRMLRLI